MSIYLSTAVFCARLKWATGPFLTICKQRVCDMQTERGSDTAIMLSGADNTGNIGSIFPVLEGNCTNRPVVT